MRGSRIAAALVLIALAVPAAASSSLNAFQSASSARALTAPVGLKGFLLNYSEPARHVFPTEPAFAWAPSPNAQRYEFQLSRSTSFRDSAIVYQNAQLPSPTATIPVTLPWVSGGSGGYGFVARVRAVTQNGTTPWSKSYGFNVRWPNVPTPLTSPDGLIRWTPVVGADGYEVWEIGITGAGAATPLDKWIFTQTNVADERDWYTFHAGSSDSSWYKTIQWRVRAIRVASRIPTTNDSPRTFYGPWSPIYTTTNSPRPVAPTPLTLDETVSDVVGTVAAPAAHGAMPGFSWTGNRGLTGGKRELYRVYIFSDSDCLNPVYIGATVGSPAYAPRISGPLALPTSQADIAAARTTVLGNGNEGQTVTWDNDPTVASESLNPIAAAVDPLDPTNLNTAAETDPNLPDTTSTAPTGTSNGPPVDPSAISVDSKWVDLWDTDWPSTGYYWTVVPVDATSSRAFQTSLVSGAAQGSTTIIVSSVGLQTGDSISIGSGGPTEEANSVAKVNGPVVTLGTALQKNHGAGEVVVRNSNLEYRETELWQDACTSGRVARFGKISQPVVTGGAKPFISGLTTNGTVVAGGTTRTFYGVPVIAWQPALGADEYEIQWSRTDYPFEPALTKIAVGTSTLMSFQALGFKPGTYYYRVRGIDFQLPKNARGMGWSKVQKVTIAPPVYTVTGG